VATTSLLTAQQRKICQTQSNQPAPNGPRAKALLALDMGSTQQQAADESGLSIGQVRYCLRRFHAVALDLFNPATPSASKPAAKTVTSAKDGAGKPAKNTKKSKNEKSSNKGKALKPVKPKSEKGDKKSKKKNKKSDKKDKKESGKKGKKKNKKT